MIGGVLLVVVLAVMFVAAVHDMIVNVQLGRFVREARKRYDDGALVALDMVRFPAPGEVRS